MSRKWSVPLEDGDIADIVAQIAAEAGDAEVAHSDEDDLYRALLEDIANHAPAPWNQRAAMVLETQKLDFPRWCA